MGGTSLQLRTANRTKRPGTRPPPRKWVVVTHLVLEPILQQHLQRPRVGHFARLHGRVVPFEALVHRGPDDILQLVVWSEFLLGPFCKDVGKDLLLQWVEARNVSIGQFATNAALGGDFDAGLYFGW
jgi:hypothetical protein